MGNRLKLIGLATLAVLIAILVFSTIVFTFSFPSAYPDYTIALEDKVTNFFERITLPLKIARLAIYPADKEILMPIYDMRVRGIADSWHAPRPDDRIHEGQDMFAPRGTPVFSGTYGYITRITQNGLGGNSVYITGAGRRRYYYTHLDRFAAGLHVGQEVTTDTVIGFVGNTGNAESTPYHLHLGLYANGVAIDPLPYLTNREK